MLKVICRTACLLWTSIAFAGDWVPLLYNTNSGATAYARSTNNPGTNVIDVLFSWGGLIDRWPTGAVDNVYLSSPLSYAGTITGSCTYVDSGTLIGDVLVHHWSNRTYTVAYTGITWTVAASNFIYTIPWTVGDCIGFRITNGSGTNAYAAHNCKK